MSKADEMFEELGYKRKIYQDTDELFELRYENNGKEVWFDKTREEFGSLSGIGVKELQAINEKCKELEWLENKALENSIPKQELEKDLKILQETKVDDKEKFWMKSGIEEYLKKLLEGK